MRQPATAIALPSPAGPFTVVAVESIADVLAKVEATRLAGAALVLLTTLDGRAQAVPLARFDDVLAMWEVTAESVDPRIQIVRPGPDPAGGRRPS